MSKISLPNKHAKSINTAIVVGGAGFVGSYVCDSLLAQNLKVIAIDDLSSGKESYVTPLKKNKDFEFLKLDIDQNKLPDFPDVKYIFHLGGIEAYINGVDLSIKTMLVNSIGTYNLLQLTKKHNAKFLLASSLDVYNGTLSSLNLKNYFGITDRDAKKYSHHESKRYAEALVTEYFRKYEIDARIVRMTDIYGPRMDLASGTEIAQLFRDATSSDTLTIHGDGLKILHPTFITDVIAGITKAMFTPETKGKIYNLTSHEPINVLNFAYTIQKSLSKPLKIQFTQEYKEIKFPLHPTEIQQTESELAWNARTKLSQGVSLTLEYYLEKSGKRIKKEEHTLKDKTNKGHTREEKTLTSQDNPTIVSFHTHTSKKPVTNKVSITNITLLSLSLFVVLYLFVFPLYALLNSNDKSIISTQTALSQETEKSATIAQKNIFYGNIQYNNLEWFFNTIQKRNSFENTRTSLQAMYELNAAIASQSKVKNQSIETIHSLLSGQGNYLQIEKTKNQINESLFNLQNALIENEIASKQLEENSYDVIFTKERTNTLKEIFSKSPSLLNQYGSQAALFQNIIQFLSPSQSRVYLVVFQNTYLPNKTDGKILGYAYFQIDRSGISKTNINSYLYKNSSDNPMDVIKDIVDSNKHLGWLPLNATFVANTSLLINIAAAQNINIDSGHIDTADNSEYQYSLWKESLDRILSSTPDKLPLIGRALHSGILTEDIKLVSQDSKGVIFIPLCDTNRILQRDFINSDDSLYPKQNEPIPYCISLQEKQISLTKAQELQKSLSLTTNSLPDNLHRMKLVVSYKNNSKSTFNEDFEVTLPGSPQLTDLQLSFPLSLDKAKQIKKDNATSYIVNIAVEPSSSKDLVLEWITTKSDQANIASGIYISKPFGSIFQNLKLITPGLSTAKISQNSDLFSR